MYDIAVIIPSRSRPKRFAETLRAIHDTTNDEVEVILGIDNDDPTWMDYMGLSGLTIYGGERKSLSAWTNYIAKALINERTVAPEFLVSMGDDHIPRTDGWHLKLAEAILNHTPNGIGFSFPDDGMNGAHLCTTWMQSTEIVTELGWMMYPFCKHMFVDNVIYEIGNAADCIVYCPDIVIEHMHPAALKSDVDIVYAESASSFGDDKREFIRWKHSTQFIKNYKAVKRLAKLPRP